MEYEYAKCMAELFLDEGCNEKIRNLRFEALQYVYVRAQDYLQKGFLPELVEAFFVKKIGMIPQISSKNEKEVFRNPSVPVYNGNGFVPSGNPFYVEEEELLLWSETSLKGPLIPAGYARYMELFQKYLPEQAEKLAI